MKFTVKKVIIPVKFKGTARPTGLILHSDAEQRCLKMSWAQNMSVLSASRYYSEL